MFLFPFSNLHELNLDWILSQVKKFSELIPPMSTAVEQVEQLSGEVAQAVEDAQTAIEDATDAVEIAQEAKDIAEQAVQGTIADGAVTTVKLADGAVTFPKLATAVQDRITSVERLNNHVLYPTGDDTDRSAEIMAKLNTYGCCELADGDYYIADSIILPNRSTLKGCGKNVRIYRTSDSTINTMLATNGTAGNVTIKDLYIVGSNETKPVADVTTGEIGLSVAGTGGKVTVENCNFYGLTNIGITTNIGYSGLVSIQVTDCIFTFCGRGLNCGINGEYANVCNCNFIECRTGASVTGGNNKFANCGFDNNYRGFTLVDDQYTAHNNGHGSAVGCSFNHNDFYAITIEYITYGYIFSGCNIFDGDIYVKKSKGIIFDSCILMGVKTGTTLHSNFTLADNDDGLISITNCCSAFDAFTITKTGTNNFVFVKNNKTAGGSIITPSNRYRQIGYKDGSSTSIAAGSYGDVSVVFPTPFPTGRVPYVFFTPQLDSTTNETGKLQFFLLTTTNTGFTIRGFNNATIARSFNFNWFAELPE